LGSRYVWGNYKNLEEPMSSTEHPMIELGRRWAQAEQEGDGEALAALTTDDFTFVGPAGFVLDRNFWANRYRSGILVTKSLDWHDVTVRDYGSAAVAVGIHTQQATHRGEPKDGSFRITHIAVDTPAGWRLAGIHLSPIMGGPA
jgi:ketosteroid isomerase-like protein